eukprot:m.352871 g.352871  ORF g.352871 m.352871 type:complete len:110 (-) comp16627_c0_seq1:1652-1981(-)
MSDDTVSTRPGSAFVSLAYALFPFGFRFFVMCLAVDDASWSNCFGTELTVVSNTRPPLPIECGVRCVKPADSRLVSDPSSFSFSFLVDMSTLQFLLALVCPLNVISCSV